MDHTVRVRIDKGEVQLFWRPGAKARTITVPSDLTEKWYDLYLIDPSGKEAETIEYPMDLSYGKGSYCRDHTPNPQFVEAFARAWGLEINIDAGEEIRRRWFDDCFGNYGVLPVFTFRSTEGVLTDAQFLGWDGGARFCVEEDDDQVFSVDLATGRVIKSETFSKDWIMSHLSDLEKLQDLVAAAIRSTRSDRP